MLKIEIFEISKNKILKFPSFCPKQLIMLGLHPLNVLEQLLVPLQPDRSYHYSSQPGATPNIISHPAVGCCQFEHTTRYMRHT